MILFSAPPGLRPTSLWESRVLPLLEGLPKRVGAIGEITLPLREIFAAINDARAADQETIAALSKQVEEYRDFESDIRKTLLGDERDDINQPTDVLAENVRQLWEQSDAKNRALEAAARPAKPEILPTPTDGSFESFERAFSSRTSGCVRDCNCGRVFYDAHNEGYSWEVGEYEKLDADPKATGLDYAVSVLYFEGRDYVVDCDCWHQRAIRLISFIRGHDEAIAAFLTEEKKRKMAEANRSPVVE